MENKKSSLFNQMRPYLKGFQLPLALAFVGAVLSNIITGLWANKLKKLPTSSLMVWLPRT